MEFLEHHFFYSILMLLTLSYPLAQSFEGRIYYYKKWRMLLPSIVLMMLIFIPWDIWFTDWSVWQFNSDYIFGVKIFQLPIEEWMFFIIVPFSCVFIHEVLNYFFNKNLESRFYLKVSLFFSVILAVFSVLYSDKLYTLVCFSLTSLSLLFYLFIIQFGLVIFFRTFFSFFDSFFIS